MLRGMDSTGIMQVDRGGKIFYVKEAVEGMYFLGHKIARKFVEDTNKSAFTITHTRAATQGKVNDDNAHPFVAHKGNAEPLVGVHNGSLTPGWRSKPGAKDFEVDSQWALAHIAARGAEAFKDINGPFCFVWAEADKKGKLFMARNSQRPMHVLFTENRNSMLFASESGMLNWLAERNGIKTEKDILVLQPDRLYEFDTNGNKVLYTSTPLPKVVHTVPPVTVVPSTPIAGKPNTVTAPPVVMGTPPASSTNAKDRMLTPLRADLGATMLNDSGQKFVDRIKLAAEGKLDITKKVEAMKPDPKEMGNATASGKEEAVVGQRDDDAPFPDEDLADLVPTNWFSERLTKAPERALALQIGFYRELQWFSGVTYDDASGDLLGDIEIYDSKNGKQTFTGVIRGVSLARAHTDYIDNSGPGGIKEGGWVVITGAYVDKLLGTVFIATELNMIGKDYMNQQKKKAH